MPLELIKLTNYINGTLPMSLSHTPNGPDRGGGGGGGRRGNRGGRGGGGQGVGYYKTIIFIYRTTKQKWKETQNKTYIYIYIIPGGIQVCGQKIGTLGAAEKEIEQLWRMEIVDVVITKNGFLFEHREVQTFSSSQIWHFDGIPLPGQPSRKTHPPPRADFWISPCGFNYEIQSTYIYIYIYIYTHMLVPELGWGKRTQALQVPFHVPPLWAMSAANSIRIRRAVD